jgi:putative ABC transport system substrate-binding protein
MELVAGRPDVILTPGYLSTKALANINQHIPMVFFLVIDPVGTGLVSSLSKPGGNLTGITDVSQDLSGKRVQLLKEAIPKLSHLAIVFAPGIASNPGLAADAEQTARALGVRVTKIELRETTDVDTALLRASSAGAQAFVVFSSGYTQARRSKLVDDSLRYRLAGSYYDAEFVANGGFMSYAASPDNIFQRVASMVDKILRGAHPGDIPVEQPTSFELKINLKSAERLEIPIPEPLKLRAELVQ